MPDLHDRLANMEKNSDQPNFDQLPITNTTGMINSAPMTSVSSATPEVLGKHSKARRRFIRFLPYFPLIITLILFVATYLYTYFKCSGFTGSDRDTCQAIGGLLWVVLVPVFIGSLIFAAVVGVIIMVMDRKKNQNSKKVDMM